MLLGAEHLTFRYASSVEVGGCVREEAISRDSSSMDKVPRKMERAEPNMSTAPSVNPTSCLENDGSCLLIALALL